ncbi:MAG: flagellar protein FlaG [Spirochaetales bacterium]|nr:flagellar protein FlaG [Spirochaetales bacterium]
MEIDLNAINTNSISSSTSAAKQATVDTSSVNINTSKVKAKSEETIKKQQQMKEVAIEKLETEIQNTEEQRQRIDAEKYLKEIIKITDTLNRKLKYSIDNNSGQVIVKVVDAETDNVIKELPPESLKRLYAKMKEAKGSIIDTLI